MIFEQSSRAPCIVQPPPAADPRCADPAFALSNPLICATTGTLIIRPSIALICEMESIQFRVFEYLNATEVEVTDDCSFTTSNVNVFAIGVNGGAGTGLLAGTVNITATRDSDGKRARAVVTVLPGESDCCDDQSVFSSVIVDVSQSMSTDFNGAEGGDYPTRLAYAKAVAAAYVANVQTLEGVPKDFLKVWTLAEEIIELEASFTGVESDLAEDIAGIEQTLEDTDLLLAVTTAADDLLAETAADRKILVIISDGAHSGTNTQAILDAATQFKTAGGIIITIGVRASGDGYDLLERMATVGFFLNGLTTNHADVISWLLYWEDLLCAGDCLPAGDTYFNSPQLEYSSFDNWEVVDGLVHLLGPGLLDLQPGNGLYVDLAGGTIRTIDSFDLEEDAIYRVTFKLAGNQRVSTQGSQVKVYVRDVTAGDGDPNEFEAVVSAAYNEDFHTYSFAFKSPAAVTVRLWFEQLGDVTKGNLLDAVKFEKTIAGQVLLEDDFDDENLIYIPPRCGPSAAVEGIDDPPAPEVEAVTYGNALGFGDRLGFIQYTYGYSWVTNNGETAATRFDFEPDEVELDGAQRKVTLEMPPEGVTAVRLWRSLGEVNKVTLAGAGTAGVNGTYVWNGSVFDQTGGGTHFIQNDGAQWSLYEDSAPLTELYICTPITNFPLGPWTTINGVGPAPTATVSFEANADMFLLAELEPHVTLYVDEETRLDFEARYDNSVTAPTENTTGVDQGYLGFGYAYCCQYGDYDSFSNLDLVPAMTSLTTPSGVISENPDSILGHNPVYAFDQISSTNWIASLTGSSFPWIQYQFDEQQIISSYRLTSIAGNGGPISWKLFGFNAGEGLTTLDFQQNAPAWSSGEERSFPVFAQLPFTHFRLEFYSAVGDALVAIREIQFERSLVDLADTSTCQDCLDDVTVQLPDPNAEATPDIEDPTAPIVTYTSTKTACFECPEGFLSLGTDATLTAFSTLTNIAAGAGPWSQIVKMDDPTAIVGHYVVQGYEADNELFGPRNFLFQGTNDDGALTDNPATVWVTLDTETNQTWTPGLLRSYYLQGQSTAYKYYRLYITAFESGDTTVGTAFNSLPTDLDFLYPQGATKICVSATMDSQVSRTHADQLAFAAALAGAQAAFAARNQCVEAFTRTVSYNATCEADDTGSGPDSVVSSSYTSAISETHALDQAQAAAQTAAIAALECE